jgi:hypothetical protein
MSFDKLNPEKLFCVLDDNAMFPELKRSMMDVFKEIKLPPQIFSTCSVSSHHLSSHHLSSHHPSSHHLSSHHLSSHPLSSRPNSSHLDSSSPNSHLVSPSVHSLFNCSLPLDRVKKVDHMYIQFLVNEKFESEYTTRTFFNFLYTSLNKNGIVWGLTLSQEFAQNIKTGTDPYHRLWKNSHAKYKSQQKRAWSNDTHAISFGNNSDFVWRYGNRNKSRGWTMLPHTFKQYCVDYKFEVITYSSVVDFYYKYANEFMTEFKQLVGYKLSYDTDWNSINMYDVFILRRM